MLFEIRYTMLGCVIHRCLIFPYHHITYQRTVRLLHQNGYERNLELDLVSKTQRYELEAIFFKFGLDFQYCSCITTCKAALPSSSVTWCVGNRHESTPGGSSTARAGAGHPGCSAQRSAVCHRRDRTRDQVEPLHGDVQVDVGAALDFHTLYM